MESPDVKPMIVPDAGNDAFLGHAASAMARSSSPYLGHPIGADFRTVSQGVSIDASIGNACSSLNCCTKQVAINQGAMSGETESLFTPIVQSSGRPYVPCGRSLPFLADLSVEMTFITIGDGLNRSQWAVSHLFPVSFRRF